MISNHLHTMHLYKLNRTRQFCALLVCMLHLEIYRGIDKKNGNDIIAFPNDSFLITIIVKTVIFSQAKRHPSIPTAFFSD